MTFSIKPSAATVSWYFAAQFGVSPTDLNKQHRLSTNSSSESPPRRCSRRPLPVTSVHKLQVDGFGRAEHGSGDRLHVGSGGIGTQLVVLYHLQNKRDTRIRQQDVC